MVPRLSIVTAKKLKEEILEAAREKGIKKLFKDLFYMDDSDEGKLKRTFSDLKLLQEPPMVVPGNLFLCGRVNQNNVDCT